MLCRDKCRLLLRHLHEMRRCSELPEPSVLVEVGMSPHEEPVNVQLQGLNGIVDMFVKVAERLIAPIHYTRNKPLLISSSVPQRKLRDRTWNEIRNQFQFWNGESSLKFQLEKFPAMCNPAVPKPIAEAPNPLVR